jgi:hypothetical protein
MSESGATGSRGITGWRTTGGVTQPFRTASARAASVGDSLRPGRGAVISATTRSRSVTRIVSPSAARRMYAQLIFQGSDADRAHAGNVLPAAALSKRARSASPLQPRSSFRNQVSAIKLHPVSLRDGYAFPREYATRKIRLAFPRFPDCWGAARAPWSAQRRCESAQPSCIRSSRSSSSGTSD